MMLTSTIIFPCEHFDLGHSDVLCTPYDLDKATSSVRGTNEGLPGRSEPWQGARPVAEVATWSQCLSDSGGHIAEVDIYIGQVVVVSGHALIDQNLWKEYLAQWMIARIAGFNEINVLSYQPKGP